MRVPFGGLESPYPFVLMLGQHETQRILDERLERLGITIERGHEVLAIDHREESVTLTLEGGATIVADWVVGCDGAHSTVRRGLGVPFSGDDYGQDWLMTEARLDGRLDRASFHVFSYTPAPTVAFPLPCGAGGCSFRRCPTAAASARRRSSLRS